MAFKKKTTNERTLPRSSLIAAFIVWVSEKSLEKATKLLSVNLRIEQLNMTPLY